MNSVGGVGELYREHAHKYQGASEGISDRPCMTYVGSDRPNGMRRNP